MKYFIIGAAGFVGSRLADRLLANKHQVTGYDNLSTGKMEFLRRAMRSKKFLFAEGDIHDRKLLTHTMKHCDFVFHLAANADVRDGLKHPGKDLKQNVVSTYYILEAMRENNIKRIAFSSTGSVYGNQTIYPTPENAPFPIQTSLYGASKIAAEGLIQAYCEGFGMTSYIFRFVSLLGKRYTHGHVKDFVEKLLEDPKSLKILGSGKKIKSYLNVSDCIDGMLLAIDKANEKINIFNLGIDDYCTARQSADWIAGYMNLNPKFIYEEGDSWVGDDNIYLDCTKMHNLGWKPKYTIKESVIETTQYLTESLVDISKWIAV